MRDQSQRDIELRSAALATKTRQVLEALQADKCGEEIDLFVERQREAFNDFSRVCDASVALEPATRANIDLVMNLEREIVIAIEGQRAALVAQDRAIASRVDLARAFHTKTPEPPQFITRRV